MTEAQMLQWLGEPTMTLNIGSQTPVYIYEAAQGWRYHIRVENGRASVISTTQRGYETAEGIGIGSTELKVRVTYGSPVRQEVHNACGATCDEEVPVSAAMCFKDGLQMGIDIPTSKVVSIQVSNKGCTL